MGPSNFEMDQSEKDETGTESISKVEKTLMDLELAACNRKVARLQSDLNEYEQKNEKLKEASEKLEKDRAAVIEQLKRSLSAKNEECKKLNDKIVCLKETSTVQKAKFKENATELDKNYKFMKHLLTAQNQLLSGKVNMLQEFTAVKNKLLMKYEKQEQEIKDKEISFKRIIYDTEKQFVISKDKLKKEMEARLLKLAQDFQEATEVRIATSTHRVIRENIAINNERHKLLSSQTQLAEQNIKLKQQARTARIAQELAEEERDKAIHKNVVQLKVIDKLTTSYQSTKDEKILFSQKNFDHSELQSRMKALTKINKDLNFQVRVLEQNLHARCIDQNRLSLLIKENDNLKSVIKEATIAIKAAMKLDEWAEADTTQTVMDRNTLLTQLLNIMNKQQDVDKLLSIDSMASLGRLYEVGDLGFVPRGSKMISKLRIPPRKFKIISSPSLASYKSPSTVSLKTVPSLKLIPHAKEDLVEHESIPSFTTSPKSTETSEEDDVHDERSQNDVGIVINNSNIQQ